MAKARDWAGIGQRADVPWASWMMQVAKKHRVYSLLGMLLQLLTLLIACEVSGVVHVALDVAAACGQAEHGENDCDQDGHECPPGCPGCHCPNGAPAWQAPTFTLARALNLPRPAAEFDWQPAQPPREIDTSGLYRPPK